MRIQGVTGDLPAVAQLMSEAPVKAEPAAAATPAPAVAAAPATSEAGGDHTSSDHRRPPRHFNSFDPPLIAQRAVLGFPLAPMVAEHAKAQGISYGAAMVEVQRVMPSKASADA